MTEPTVHAGLARLNAMPQAELAEHLRECCGSVHWMEQMIARRPFASTDSMLAASDDACRVLTREDWIEAFEHHPRLGESQASVPQGARSRAWSEKEQASLADVGTELRSALAAANRAYEQRFGYICIICASGRDSEELLAITRARLGNAPNIELRIAAEEQRKITRLRLQKLVLDLAAEAQA
ncbi:MAG: decarboxylase [Gemmatimonadetes bacterium]|jgi:OHCU decarboxylase|nr:decarboxylase [Gemmatimonadota bacterium]